ncbi:hypothetical protein F994_02741 [Acinetobacter bohemicus ANC 3994]|uniref:LysR substrate-binding domain-containing protein n=1 Tax=Acinetobacter bohemicus ANC 3994 TaxID=1217715 RepID=N8Q6E0_9GAMM|nr:hypothetical protein F994_02741 [Acinetobacter bohemicus ANC 3994]
MHYVILLWLRLQVALQLQQSTFKFLVQIRDVLDTLDFTNEQVAGKGSGVRGLVRINTAVALGRLHISRIVNKLQDVYPDLSVELVPTDTFIDPV